MSIRLANTERRFLAAKRLAPGKSNIYVVLYEYRTTSAGAIEYVCHYYNEDNRDFYNGFYSTDLTAVMAEFTKRGDL
jgi:hypothetical protein